MPRGDSPCHFIRAQESTVAIEKNIVPNTIDIYPAVNEPPSGKNRHESDFLEKDGDNIDARMREADIFRGKIYMEDANASQ